MQPKKWIPIRGIEQERDEGLFTRKFMAVQVP